MDNIETRLNGFILKLDIILKESKEKDIVIEELKRILEQLYFERLKEKNPEAYAEIITRGKSKKSSHERA